MTDSQSPYEVYKSDVSYFSGGLDILHADGVISSGIADHFVLPRDPAIHTKHKQSWTQLLLGQPRN